MTTASFAATSTTADTAVGRPPLDVCHPRGHCHRRTGRRRCCCRRHPCPEARRAGTESSPSRPPPRSLSAAVARRGPGGGPHHRGWGCHGPKAEALTTTKQGVIFYFFLSLRKPRRQSLSCKGEARSARSVSREGKARAVSAQREPRGQSPSTPPAPTRLHRLPRPLGYTRLPRPVCVHGGVGLEMGFRCKFCITSCPDC